MAGSSSTSNSLSLSATALHHLITIVFVKLNLTNYLVWRMQILPLIESFKVKDLLVNGLPAENKNDDKGEAGPNIETLKEKDLLLKSWITGTLFEEVLYLVVGCTMAKAVWLCLEENFLHATKEREVQLKQRMQDLKLRNRSLSEYLKAVKTIFDGLAAIQKTVADEDKVIYMSRGLGKKYSTLVTSMLAKPPFPTYTQFVIAVQNYEIHLQSFELENKAVDQTMAFVSQRQQGRGQEQHNSRGRGRGNNGQYNSHGCGFTAVGQNQGSRPTPIATNNGQQYNSQPHGQQQFQSGNAVFHPPNFNQRFQNNSTGHQGIGTPDPCQICGKRNHTAMKCFYR